MRKLAPALVIAFAASLLPRAAGAYCRTTTLPLPSTYSPTAGCYAEGLLLFWRNACVGFSINQESSRNIPYADAKRIIDASFSTWTDASCSATGKAPGITATDLGGAQCDEVRYNPSSANQNLIVFRDDSWPYDDKYSTLGLTTVTFNAETGEIYDADMEINSSERNLSISDQVPANGFDLASVVTHEAGHFFGLAHATNAASTMFASYKPGTIALRTLAPDDVEGICAIYPNASTRIVSAEVDARGEVPADPCDANPRHGLTTSCVEAPVAEDGCAVGPRRAAPWSASACAGAALAFALIVRRCPSRRVRAD